MSNCEVLDPTTESRFCILSGIGAIVATSMDEIRALTSAATIAAYYVDGLEPDQLADNRRVVEVSASTCVAAARSDHQHFAAAFDEAGLAGFVVATRHAVGDLELAWLMVHPRHHGSGVAAALMQEGLNWLGEDWPIRLAIIRHNERAIRFYRRFGFEIDATVSTAHAVPHWIMRRLPRGNTAMAHRSKTAAGRSHDTLGPNLPLGLVLRSATLEDVPLLVTLLRRSWLATFAADLPFEAVQLFASQDPAHAYAKGMWPAFIVAEVDGRVAGMSHVVDDVIAAIHVEPSMKRRGVGTALMDAAEACILGRFNVARLEVLAFNSGARAFYANRGWREARQFRTTECGAAVHAIEMVKASC